MDFREQLEEPPPKDVVAGAIDETLTAGQEPVKFKLRSLIAFTAKNICDNVGQFPAQGHWPINQQQANALGVVWEYYILNMPEAKRRKAAIKMVEALSGPVMAYGTTALVFGPRVLLTLKQLQSANADLLKGMGYATSRPSVRSASGDGRATHPGISSPGAPVQPGASDDATTGSRTGGAGANSDLGVNPPPSDIGL